MIRIDGSLVPSVMFFSCRAGTQGSVAIALRKVKGYSFECFYKSGSGLLQGCDGILACNAGEIIKEFT